MHALIADFAIAVFPEPMPVVVDMQARLFAIHIDSEFEITRRALPQPPVETLGDRSGFAVADGFSISILVNIAPAHANFSNEAIVNQFHITDERGVRAALRSVLHNAAIFLRCRHDLTTFKNVVRKWLLDINVLAGLTRPHRRERMPMVWRSNGHSVDFLVGQRVADVFV